MVLRTILLKLIDTRVERNAKFEMYTGSYYGHGIEAIKIYSRKTSFHPFKFSTELFKCDLQEEPFSDVNNMKKLIESHEGLVK